MYESIAHMTCPDDAPHLMYSSAWVVCPGWKARAVMFINRAALARPACAAQRRGWQQTARRSLEFLSFGARQVAYSRAPEQLQLPS